MEEYIKDDIQHFADVVIENGKLDESKRNEVIAEVEKRTLKNKKFMDNLKKYEDEDPEILIDVIENLVWQEFVRVVKEFNRVEKERLK